MMPPHTPPKLPRDPAPSAQSSFGPACTYLLLSPRPSLITLSTITVAFRCPAWLPTAAFILSEKPLSRALEGAPPSLPLSPSLPRTHKLKTGGSAHHKNSVHIAGIWNMLFWVLPFPCPPQTLTARPQTSGYWEEVPPPPC